MTTIAESSKIENLKSMLAEMDQALCDEIEEQTRFPRREHTGVGGELLSESNGQYIYSFTLIEPWEPQDDTPLLVANAPTPISCTVVNSKGNQLIIASDSPLPQNILQQIELCDDSTELTKRLREVLKKVGNYIGAQATGNGLPAKTAASAANRGCPCLCIVER